ncbi:MAG: CBS domain-containing protein [Rhodoferax sp.]|nr:CBS domain-containing protein [Rhodoferax sp.]
MFSVYGRAGRIFRGSMEELRKVAAVSGLIRARRIAPIGQDTQDMTHEAHETLDMAHSVVDTVHGRAQDIAHRSAMAAYTLSAREQAHRHPLSRVKHIMTRPVITLPNTANVGDAWALFTERGVGQAPVVNADNVLEGLLTRSHLSHPDRLPGPEMHVLEWRAILAQRVVDVMWTPVPGVSVDTDIRHLARVLLDTDLPGLPVADDFGQVIGFVSRTDILRAVVADPPLDLWG